MNRTLRLLLPVVLLLAGFASAQAQISVSLSLKRRLYIHHEPILATVSITNQMGRDIVLEDTEQLPWFGFQINGADNTVVPPRNPDYALDPYELKAGATVQRTVNLNELYALGEFGIFRARATIHLSGLGKFFSSRPVAFEVTDGTLLWKQTAGVPQGLPGGGTMRTYSMLSHHVGDYKMLYVRVEDREQGRIYCTHQLGRLIEGQPPQAQFDAANNLYVLQLVGQRSHTLTKISPDGEFLGRTNYSAPKSRPYFRKLADGTLQIVGGRREVAVAQNAETAPPAKLSDRPAGLPKD
ncbi:MAG TPA: hypothetical protein VGO90_16420 [Chthoniobacteraceae bacterium]|jgi:hypothetical protein|nr:hypothetical protein [Chthoniobacter sp.]HEV7869275.1 hypothetical protein [Chthoniobacteraceae bacterium]